MNPFSLIIASIFLLLPFSKEGIVVPETASLTVYIFIHESCRISQYYTLTLKELHQTYGNENIQFKGVFPNQSTKEADMLAFQEKYNLDFPMVFDKDQVLTQQLGATITPEVIVVNTQSQEIIYKGRIDNAYFRVGKRRQVTTSQELKEVLKANKTGKLLGIKAQPAIGCFIKKKSKFW